MSKKNKVTTMKDIRKQLFEAKYHIMGPAINEFEPAARCMLDIPVPENATLPEYIVIDLSHIYKRKGADRNED